jgi:cysteine-rich repeat protein
MYRLALCAFALAAACTMSGPQKDQSPSIGTPEQTQQLDPSSDVDAAMPPADAGMPVDAPCDAATLCGNGVIDPGEQCDDGSANGTAGDTCSATCQCMPS